MNFLKFIAATLAVGTISAILPAAELPVSITLDPVSANAYIRYQVPGNAPDPVTVKARFKLQKDDAFKPAAINKFRSEAVLHGYVRNNSKTLQEEQQKGEVLEYLAAGRERTLVWRTFPQLPVGGPVAGEIEVTLEDPKHPGQAIAQGSVPFKLDLSAVKVLDKFADNPNLFPSGSVAQERGKNPGWHDSNRGLDCVEKGDFLEPLVWRHGLRGKYAIYVYLPWTGYSMISLRLSSDDYAQRFASVDGFEQFWKITDVSDTHLVIQEYYAFLTKIGDNARARLSYVKLVPVSDEIYHQWQTRFNPKHDKIVAAFFEPYSWSFSEYVRDNGKFSEPMAAYREAGVDLVDVQAGRHGSKPLFPTDLNMPLLESTRGDAHIGKDGKVSAGTVSLGTGRMGRLCDAIRASLKYANAEKLPCSINFGSVSYHPGSSLRSEFSEQHPEFACKDNNSFLDFSHEEVVKYYLQHFEEALKRGAKMLTANFKSYPHGIQNAAQSLNILRRLRKLADSYAAPGERIAIMVVFPFPGNRNITNGNKFQPRDWIKENLIDYLVPCSLSAGGDYFSKASEYVQMAKGTPVKVLMEFTSSSNSAIYPDEPLALAQRWYQEGADGVYIYQSDARIVGSMNAAHQEERRWINVLGSTRAVDAELAALAAQKNAYSVDAVTNYTYLFQADRVQIQLDGITPVKMTLSLLDSSGKVLVKSERTAWPWILGEFGVANHYPVGGPYVVKVRAEDASGKIFEKELPIPRINRSVTN